MGPHGVADRLAGAQRDALERTLYHMWASTDGPGLPAEADPLVQALVCLRRMGHDVYRPAAHRTLLGAESPFLSPNLAAQVSYVAFPVGSRVQVLGAECGVVVAWFVGYSPGESCPAPWYAVCDARLTRCRAHGADEIEAIATRWTDATTSGTTARRPDHGRTAPGGR